MPEHLLARPARSTVLIVGGGTMGADVAMVCARAGCRTIVLESGEARRNMLPDYFRRGLAHLGFPQRTGRVSTCATIDDVDWDKVDLVIECIPDRLDIKQALFADLERRARANTILASNRSSATARAGKLGLWLATRMLG